MSDVDRLVAVEEIKRLKARYFRCMDTKDWEGYRNVFTADAVMDMSGEMNDAAGAGSGIVKGAAEIVDWVRESIESILTIHRGFMPEIEITSPTTGTGVWAMEDQLGRPGAGRTVAGSGHYHEVYRKVDGEWRIQSTRLTRLAKVVTRTYLA